MDSIPLGFSRESFKVTLNLSPSLTLISAIWNKILVVNMPLLRLEHRTNEYNSAIAVKHSAIVQFIREIGDTNTNFISFSFKTFLSTNPFVQFHSRSSNNLGKDVWVESLLCTYQFMKWGTLLVPYNQVTTNTTNKRPYTTKKCLPAVNKNYIRKWYTPRLEFS